MNKHRNPRGPMMDMRDFAREVVKLTRDRAVADVAKNADPMLRLAIERGLEIVGEAANHVPHEVQAQFPEIPWAQIIGMRNLLAHGYDSVDPQKLWDTAAVSLPELLRHLDAAIEKQPPFEI